MATRLARIEAHMERCILRGSSCEYWSEMHETKLTWATNRINEAMRERVELTKKVEELSDQVVELTTRLNQGESRIQSVERACTIRASDFHTQLYRIQGNMGHQSTSTINPASTPPHEHASLNSREPIHPSVVRREGGDLHHVSVSVQPTQEPPRPPDTHNPCGLGFLRTLSPPLLFTKAPRCIQRCEEYLSRLDVFQRRE